MFLQLAATATALVLLSAPSAISASPFDGVWGQDGESYVEIRGTSIKDLTPRTDPTVCYVEYEGMTIKGDLANARFTFVCGDGSTGGVGTSTMVYDDGTITFIDCMGVSHNDKEMECEEPDLLEKISN
jgi:hypothetical protein